MFNKELFLELCKVYNVNMASDTGRTQIVKDGIQRDLLLQDFPSVFFCDASSEIVYSNIKSPPKFPLDELLIA